MLERGAVGLGRVVKEAAKGSEEAAADPEAGVLRAATLEERAVKAEAGLVKVVAGSEEVAVSAMAAAGGKSELECVRRG